MHFHSLSALCTLTQCYSRMMRYLGDFPEGFVAGFQDFWYDSQAIFQSRQDYNSGLLVFYFSGDMVWITDKKTAEKR